MESDSHNKATVWIPEETPSAESCLENYLINNLFNTKKRLPGELANEDFEIFKGNTLKLTRHLDNFLDSDEQKTAFLVLGKIQSGKTAHLLSAIAWASDSRISLATVFTGTNNALNTQTIKRVKNDLSKTINGSYIKLFDVPTKAVGKKYDNLLDEVSNLIERRNDSKNKFGSRKLPVFVTMKNPTRIATLNKLITELAIQFPGEITTLLIDDEADQASPNTKADKREVSKTYQAIADLRDINSPQGESIRNILLSYTATPQAVLLAELDSRLRPNYCVTIHPRYGYFGITSITDSSFQLHLKSADDWTSELDDEEIAPTSLINAMITFLITGWIRKYYPAVFYGNSDLPINDFSGRMKSVQMLIHESHKQENHEDVHNLVYKQIKLLTHRFEKALNYQEFENQVLVDFADFQNIYAEILSNLKPNLATYLPKIISIEIINNLAHLLADSERIVINAADDKLGYGGEVPIEDSEWGDNLWFVIGGNILGRGLTIPQLTTTYFVRHAKKPNFDTISQHMRFCGYRNDYSHLIYLYAQDRTYKTFEVMNEVDQVVWQLANKWSEESLDIYKQIPPVMYASRNSQSLDPTRKSIQDPEIIDKRLKSGIFSSTNIATPNFLNSNVKLINKFLNENSKVIEPIGDHLLLKFKKSVVIPDLLLDLKFDTRESEIVRDLIALFDPELGQLGLYDVDVSIFIDNSLVNFEINNYFDSEGNLTYREKLGREINSRGSNRTMPDADLRNWRASYEAANNTNMADETWPKIDVPHIGDGQRKLRKIGGEDELFLVIEPMFVHIKGKEGKKIGFGLAVTLLGPENFDVRIIGLRRRVSKFVEMD